MMRDIDFHLKYCILGGDLKLGSTRKEPTREPFICYSVRIRRAQGSCNDAF